MTHKELADKFQKLNNNVAVKEWYTLIGDECEQYADTTQPIIKVILDDDGSWLRVYVDKKYHEITWY